VYKAKRYEKGEIPEDCSSFALSLVGKIDLKEPIIDLGCGNGRDTIFFLRKGAAHVTAVDLSEYAVSSLSEKIFAEQDRVSIIHGDFTRLPKIDQRFGTAYTRFSLHSVSEEAASQCLCWVFEHLIDGGLLCIEARSVNDKLCGKGTPVSGERNAWICDHYRRFICLQELEAELVRIGFVILLSMESNGLAVYKDDDPEVIRIHAKRK